MHDPTLRITARSHLLQQLTCRSSIAVERLRCDRSLTEMQTPLWNRYVQQTPRLNSQPRRNHAAMRSRIPSAGRCCWSQPDCRIICRSYRLASTVSWRSEFRAADSELQLS